MPRMHKKLRDALIKEFITDSDTVRLMVADEDVPGCFGTLPQGNESAWAQGCKQCDLYLHSDACAQATHKVRAEIDAEEDRRAFITKDGVKCEKCNGSGTLIAPFKHARKCHHCHGTGRQVEQCPKCKATSGCDWSQCKGDCPMKASPHYHRYLLKTDDRGPLFIDREHPDNPMKAKAIVEQLNQLTKDLAVAKHNAAVCHCGSLMSEHSPQGSCTAPVEMNPPCPNAQQH